MSNRMGHSVEGGDAAEQSTTRIRLARRQRDDGDVRVLANALEHDALPVRRHIESVERLAVLQCRQLSPLSGREVEQPEVLTSESTQLQHHGVAVRKKPVAVADA